MGCIIIFLSICCAFVRVEYKDVPEKTSEIWTLNCPFVWTHFDFFAESFMLLLTPPKDWSQGILVLITIENIFDGNWTITSRIIVLLTIAPWIIVLRTIAPWIIVLRTIAPWIIVPQTIVPCIIATRTIAPENCYLRNCPPDN